MEKRHLYNINKKCKLANRRLRAGIGSNEHKNLESLSMESIEKLIVDLLELLDIASRECAASNCVPNECGM